jgi:Uma2 family endonuclease
MTQRIPSPAFCHRRSEGAGIGGCYILYEPERHLWADVLVPDWGGWRRTSMPHRPETAYATLPPDRLCEILSPSTSSFDRAKKLAIYAREGVPWAWRIDPLARTPEVLKLESDRWCIL